MYFYTFGSLTNMGLNYIWLYEPGLSYNSFHAFYIPDERSIWNEISIQNQVKFRKWKRNIFLSIFNIPVESIQYSWAYTFNIAIPIRVNCLGRENLSESQRLRVRIFSVKIILLFSYCTLCWLHT